MAGSVLDVIEREGLADNARRVGQQLHDGLGALAREFPGVIRSVRGLGLMLGFEIAPKDEVGALAASDKAASIQVVLRLHEAGLLSIPSGTQVVRLLPALNLGASEADEGLAIIGKVIRSLA